MLFSARGIKDVGESDPDLMIRDIFFALCEKKLNFFFQILENAYNEVLEYQFGAVP